MDEVEMTTYWNEKIETLPREELAELQLERLQLTLNRAYAKVDQENTLYHGGRPGRPLPLWPVLCAVEINCPAQVFLSPKGATHCDRLYSERCPKLVGTNGATYDRHGNLY